MTDRNIEGLIQTLRPGLSQAAVRDILASCGPSLSFERLTSKDRKDRHITSRPIRIDFCMRGETVRTIAFTHELGTETAVGGIRIGTSFDDARSRWPDAEARGKPEGRAMLIRRDDAAGGYYYVNFSTGTGTVNLISLVSVEEHERMEAAHNENAAKKEARTALIERAQDWRSIEDPDAMLSHWSRHLRNGIPDEAQRLCEWLIGQSTPEDRHVVVQSYDWDRGYAPLFWIIRNTATALATALDLFWMTDPDFPLLQISDGKAPNPGDEETRRLALEIRDHVNRNFYLKERKPIECPIAFKPPENVGATIALAKRLDPVFPDLAFHPIKGRTVDRNSHRMTCPVDFA